MQTVKRVVVCNKSWIYFENLSTFMLRQRFLYPLLSSSFSIMELLLKHLLNVTIYS